MEAASARYAARDRFAFPTEPAATPLQRYIQNACSPENFEPNLALCLEIADLINAKKGNAPREAAVSVVGYINHRNPNVSMLALSLLDICVKNCGYPFHLQISTKEFLNELVRRFPERPPLRLTRVQSRILELIEEWRRTICETSKYKEDLGFIRDMHRLLAYKGYQFPEIRREDAAVLNPSDNLKSAEEMEAEERAAQSAKLQELIRRGTPHDLQEANRLMKVMAGYDTRHKTDYRAKAASEVAQVQQKAKLLEEMLQGYKPGDEVKEGDVFAELANALASAHPKIQRMCEEESEDTEAVAKLFEINDSIHRTIERYRLIKKGDIAGANAIPRGTLGVSGAGVRTGPGNELSLIDFGGPDEEAEPNHAASSQTPVKTGNALEDDLLGLNMGDDLLSSGGGISLGGAPASSKTDIMAHFSQPSQSLVQTAPNSIFTMPSQLPTSKSPNADLFGSFTSASSRPPSTNPPNPHHSKPLDPFASLTSPSRQVPPLVSAAAKPPQSVPKASTSLLDMGNGNGVSSSVTSNHDDEWTFTSALPDQPKEMIVTNESLRTVFSVIRSNDSDIAIHSKISNNTPLPIQDLTFQLAVTKSYTLHLQPQSSRNLAPHQRDGITQMINLQGVERGKGANVKLRWRATYTLGGADTEVRHEQGEINGLEVP